jgi:release factor glutamine methyltransferase
VGLQVRPAWAQAPRQRQPPTTHLAWQPLGEASPLEPHFNSSSDLDASTWRPGLAQASTRAAAAGQVTPRRAHDSDVPGRPREHPAHALQQRGLRAVGRARPPCPPPPPPARPPPPALDALPPRRCPQDSFLLADALLALADASWDAAPPALVLEVGVGSGYVLASAGRLLRAARPPAGGRLLGTDRAPVAAAAARATLAAHGLAGAADVVVTDLVGGLAARLAGAVDLLLFNPPYVPTPESEVARGGIAAAWAGGARGRAVADRLLPALPALLSPHGQALIVAVPDNDPAGMLAEAAARGLAGRVLAQRSADEERLLVLHLWRAAAPPPPAVLEIFVR